MPDLPSDVSAVKPANGGPQVRPVGNSVPLTQAAQNVADMVHDETNRQTGEIAQVVHQAANPLGIPAMGWWVGQYGAMGLIMILLVYQTVYDRPQQQAHYDIQLQSIRDESNRHNDDAVKAVQANTLALTEVKTLLQLQLKLKPAEDDDN